MASNSYVRQGVPRRMGLRGVVLTVAISALSSACTYVPDALNPAEWYRDTSDYFFGDDEEQAAQSDNRAEQQSDVVRDRGVPPPGADQPFPSLSTVPERPPETSSPQNRAQVAEGLVADRERARYSSDVIQRQGEPVAPLRREQSAPTSAGSAPPPPPAVPVPPVSSTTAAQQPQSAAAMQSAPSTSSPSASSRPPSPPPMEPAPSRAPAMTGQVQSVPPMPQAAPNRSSASVEEVYRQNLAQRYIPQVESPTAQPRSANSVAPTLDRFETVFVSSSGVQLGTDTPGGSEQVAAASSAPQRPAPSGTAPFGRVPGSGTGAGQSDINTFLTRPDAASANGERVATIVFGVGSANLTARDRRILRDVATLHNERGGKVRIDGHASHRTRSMDPVRHKLVNYQMSLRRANAVTSELMRQGVARDDIVVDARSDSEPVYYEVMPTGEAGNRRAEIYFVSN